MEFDLNQLNSLELQRKKKLAENGNILMNNGLDDVPLISSTHTRARWIQHHNVLYKMRYLNIVRIIHLLVVE